MQNDIMDMIRTIANTVTLDDLQRLRIEEELLVMLLKNPDRALATKATALMRLKEINAAQLKMLGG